MDSDRSVNNNESPINILDDVFDRQNLEFVVHLPGNSSQSLDMVSAMFTLMDMASIMPSFEDTITTAMRLSLEEEELTKNDDIFLNIPEEKFSNEERKYSTCSICMDDFLSNDSVVPLNCTHTFHSHCISDWVKYKADCPICRESISYQLHSLQQKEDELLIKVMELTGKNREDLNNIVEHTGSMANAVISIANEWVTD